MGHMWPMEGSSKARWSLMAGHSMENVCLRPDSTQKISRSQSCDPRKEVG